MALEILHEDSEASARRTDRPARGWTLRSAPRLRAADRILFTERLALQLATGLPLHAALQALHQQAENPRMRQLIGELVGAVVEGKKFSEALAMHAPFFSHAYVNLIAASEGGGFMAQVLEQLVEMDEKQERLRASMVAAFSYPVFLMVFSAGVVIFILTAVFPKFTAMFASMRVDLPLSTRVLMSASDLLLNHAGAIALAVAVVVGLGYALLSRPAGKAWCDRMVLRAPGLRQIFIEAYLIRFMRTMGASLQHGVTIPDTLTACRQIVGNAEFQAFVRRLERDVHQGKGIAEGFGETRFIPPSVLQMITTGEETGRLDHVMLRIADFYDRNLTRRLGQLAKLAEPIMLLVMGGIVGIIVSSLVLPIFKLSRAMH